ncbi:hypothetical protein [Legionella sainthelensi]|uniref:hypothetical protein n=1 Tax=Legionella sainthelensi TaxID=28087 RepID=UPI000E1FDA9C|nr:hypothetical protein [Legionella sainthelensi]
MICWICNAKDATSREHKIKKSDLKSSSKSISQDAPLYYNEFNNTENKKTIRNKRIGSFNADILKFEHYICHHCNTTRTQLHDRAWETFSRNICLKITLLKSTTQQIRFNKIFPYNTRYNMLNVHLYFVKLFGCRIMENNLKSTQKIPLDISSFSKSILNGKAHQHLYLSFKYNSNPDCIAGHSQIEAAINSNNQFAFGVWFYDIGQLRVSVMYALPEEKREGLKTSWNPKFGYKRFTIEKI